MPPRGVELDEIDLLFLGVSIVLLGWAVVQLSRRQDVIAADLADAHELSRKAIHLAADAYADATADARADAPKGMTDE